MSEIIEIDAKELERLRKIETMFMHAIADKTGLYFICGEAGEKDKMGLPKGILVCPQMGLDGFAYYKKEKDYSSPSW